MNVGIVGSRRWKSRAAVESLVKTLPPNTTVVSGGARGVDSWAVEYARKCGLKVKEFLLWNTLIGIVKFLLMKSIKLQ